MRPAVISRSVTRKSTALSICPSTKLSWRSMRW
jgi:hypothetical protein